MLSSADVIVGMPWDQQNRIEAGIKRGKHQLRSSGEPKEPLKNHLTRPGVVEFGLGAPAKILNYSV